MATFECSICEATVTDQWGNNPDPFRGDKCCNECDRRFVVPLRIVLGREFKDTRILTLLKTMASLGREIKPRNAQIITFKK